MGCHGEAGVAVALGQTRSVCVRRCVSELPCICSLEGGNSVSSVTDCSRIHVFFPVPSLAFDSVSSCQRLAGNLGT